MRETAWLALALVWATGYLPALLSHRAWLRRIGHLFGVGSLLQLAMFGLVWPSLFTVMTLLSVPCLFLFIGALVRPSVADGWPRKLYASCCVGFGVTAAAMNHDWMQALHAQDEGGVFCASSRSLPARCVVLERDGRAAYVGWDASTPLVQGKWQGLVSNEGPVVLLEGFPRSTARAGAHATPELRVIKAWTGEVALQPDRDGRARYVRLAGTAGTGACASCEAP